MQELFGTEIRGFSNARTQVR